MLRVPDFKMREIFLLLGATENNVDELVSIFQTRHTQPLPLESRITYFNFLGLEDSWERIVHTVRGEDLKSIIDFLIAQAPDSLTYKRGVDKLCQFIFSPNLVEQLEEMWHRHSFHTHDPKRTWERALEMAAAQDDSGRLAEDLVGQLFEMKGKTPLRIGIMAEFCGKKKSFSGGIWRPLNLEERLAFMKSGQDAFETWMRDLPVLEEATLRSAEIREFEAFIKTLQKQAKEPQDISAIFECIQHFETKVEIPLPELRTHVRRYFFEKFIEPYRSVQYQ